MSPGLPASLHNNWHWLSKLQRSFEHVKYQKSVGQKVFGKHCRLADLLTNHSEVIKLIEIPIKFEDMYTYIFSGEIAIENVVSCLGWRFIRPRRVHGVDSGGT